AAAPPAVPPPPLPDALPISAGLPLSHRTVGVRLTRRVLGGRCGSFRGSQVRVDACPGERSGSRGRADLREQVGGIARDPDSRDLDRKSTRLNSSHVKISYAV